ncbi:MAG TPA: hypothetical protein DEA75_11110 [Rhodobacteraceae bacterium]|nr:hypothetical protein [Paracoccaceae bacterium]
MSVHFHRRRRDALDFTSHARGEPMSNVIDFPSDAEIKNKLDDVAENITEAMTQCERWFNTREELCDLLAEGMRTIGITEMQTGGVTYKLVGDDLHIERAVH